MKMIGYQESWLCKDSQGVPLQSGDEIEVIEEEDGRKGDLKYAYCGKGAKGKILKINYCGGGHLHVKFSDETAGCFSRNVRKIN